MSADNNLGVGYGRYKVGTVIDINDPLQQRCLVKWHGENEGLQPNECQWVTLRKGSDDPGYQQNGKFVGMRPGATIYGTSYETDNQYCEFHGTIPKLADPDGSPNSDIPQSCKSDQVGPNISSDSSQYSQSKKGDVYHDSQFSSYDHEGKNIFDYCRDHGPPGEGGKPSGKKSKHAKNKDSCGYYTFGDPGKGDYSTGSKGGIKKEPGSLVRHLASSGENNQSAAVSNAAKTLASNFYQNTVKMGANKKYNEFGFGAQQDQQQSSQQKQDQQNQDQPGGQDPQPHDDIQLNNFLNGDSSPTFSDQQLQDMNSNDNSGTSTPDPGNPSEALVS